MRPFDALSSLYRFVLNALGASDVPRYKFPAATKETLDYADLAVIDLSLAETEDGRQHLAAQVTKAMQNEGFFYVINHGWSEAKTNRMFNIGNLLFDNVTEEEKMAYTDKSTDVYEGYKIKNLWEVAPGVKDRIEHYNINRTVTKKPHPKTIRPYIKDIDEFVRHNHFDILYPILRVMAIGLGLPEETLVNQHRFEDAGESSARFMKYYPRPKSEEEKAKNIWLKGHTDIGSVTILWSQPVGGLQILTKDGEWKWVRHMKNALVINSGDALGFLCGNYYPPTRHRVFQPPKDQANVARLGAFYFSMPSDNVPLTPHTESPVLQKMTIDPEWNPTHPPTMDAWRKARSASYGQVQLTKGKEAGVEEEVIAGITVKHYN